MDENDFPELVRIKAQHTKTIKLYWLSAILFWAGFLFSLSYYISQTGTIPSIWPGVLMIIGFALYLILHYSIKMKS